MGSVVKSIMGGGSGAAQKNAQGAALASLLAREADVNAEIGADGGSRRKRGRQLLTYLNDEPASLN